jgi:hypothetical protein
MASETSVKCARPPCQCRLEAEQQCRGASCSNGRAIKQWIHDDFVDMRTNRIRF